MSGLLWGFPVFSLSCFAPKTAWTSGLFAPPWLMGWVGFDSDELLVTLSFGLAKCKSCCCTPSLNLPSFSRLSGTGSDFRGRHPVDWQD